MAERSFAREVEDLKLGNGDIFRGEGILAITKALLQSGVGYVGGYQGAPISHLMDVLADAQDILGELGVHFETSANEAAAAAIGQLDQLRSTGPTPRETFDAEVARIAQEKLPPLRMRSSLFIGWMMA